jgi:hypothetical protein
MAAMKYSGNVVPSKTVCRFALVTARYSTRGNASARKKKRKLRKFRSTS